MMRKFILLLLSFYVIVPQIFANELTSNKTIYQKYNKEIQKSIHHLPNINETSIDNHQLVVRSKNNNDKWVNSYYPFYWATIGTIDFDDSYITIRANKSNYAQSKHSLSILEYQKDGSIIGFIKTYIMKNSRTRKKIIAFQYKVKNALVKNDKSWHVAKLQHVILIDVNTKNHKYLQFIYDSDGTLLCYQINNDTYINTGNKNLLINTNGLKLDEDDSWRKTFIKFLKKATYNTFALAVWFIKGDN